jgi:hypothetical protein
MVAGHNIAGKGPHFNLFPLTRPKVLGHHVGEFTKETCMKRALALIAAMLILAGLPFAQTMSNMTKVATVYHGVRWSQCAFGPDGVLHVIFEDDTDTGHPIMYVKYDGTTSTTPFNVTGDEYMRGERPGIGVGPRGQVAVAWGVDVGDYTYVRVYDPRTKAWGPVETVAAGYGWDEPQPAIDSNGTLHVFFSSDSGGRAYCASKINGVWEAPVRLSGGYGKQGGVAVGPNNTAYAVWREKGSNGVYKNYYSSRPAGGNWAEGKIATTSGGSSSHPSITVGPDSVPVLAWGDIDAVLENGAEIRIIRPTTGAAREIVIPFGMQHYPRAAVDPDLHTHVVAQLGGGDTGSGAADVHNTTGSWSAGQGLLSNMNKVVGLSADGYGNVALCMSDWTSTGSDIYVYSTAAITPRFIYPPTNPAAAIKSKGLRKSPEITYNLSWTANTANTDAYVGGYNIYVKEGSGEYRLLMSVSKTTLSASFTFTSLSAKRRFGICTANPTGGESEMVEF